MLGGKFGRVLTAAFPVPLLELTLGALLIFAACNLVVFQSWNWDNTKLLVYWYLVIALLIGALAAHWWRRVWPRVAAIAAGGAGAADGRARRAPAAALDAAAGRDHRSIHDREHAGAATCLDNRPRDPGGRCVPDLRPSQRPCARRGRAHRRDGLRRLALELRHQLRDALRGCPDLYTGCATGAATCPVFSLLRKYGISYVEIDDRLTDPGAIDPRVESHVVGGPGAPGRRAHRPHHHLRRPWEGLT